MNNDITVPYAFVPLSKWVFTPEWAYQVSQDIPFDDGITGAVTLSLVNATELCVGGSSDKSSVKNEVKWGTTPDDNRLIIPGTTVKGMLRNIVEIAGFAKFRDYVNKRCSFREIKSDSTYMNEYKELRQEPGFLNRDNDGWYVIPCKCARLSNEQINRKFFGGKEQIRNFTPGAGTNKSKSKGGTIQQQSAACKYKIFQNAGIDVLNTDYTAVIEENSFKKGVPNKATLANSGSLKKGRIVCCNYRLVSEQAKKSDISNKDYSYFFYGINREQAPGKDDRISDEVVNDFKSSQEQELTDYLFSNPSRDLGIPVWILKKSNGEIKELGICRMPRLMHKYSVGDLVKKHQGDYLKEHLFDLSQIMFGSVYPDSQNSKTNMSLKSRIGCSDFISTAKTKLKAEKLCLQGPKISFNNAYLVSPNGQATDYSSNTSVPAGWKRYLVRDRLYPSQNNEKINDSQLSTVNFAPPGTIFSGKILFHNLRRFELGALLWAVKFMQDEGCYHSLGHAKPYGAGAVRFQDIRLEFPSYDTDSSSNVDSYINYFEEEMNRLYPGKDGVSEPWKNSPQIRNLREISMVHTNPDGKIYNTLKEFTDRIKKNKEILGYQESWEEKSTYPQDGVDLNRARQSAPDLPVSFLRDVMGIGASEIGKDQIEKWTTEKRESVLASSGLSEKDIELIRQLDEFADKLSRLYKDEDFKDHPDLTLQQAREKCFNFLERLDQEPRADRQVVGRFLEVFGSKKLPESIFKISKIMRTKNPSYAEQIKKKKECFDNLKKALGK